MNAACLCLISALLAGAAAILLELSWLRAAAAALPGTLPAAALVVPVFLLAWSAGSTVAGRVADRRGDQLDDQLGLAARWLGASALAVLGVPWLMGFLLESGPLDSVAMRVVVGGLPVAPAAFGLGGALPLFARLRRADGLPAARATGGVAACVAAGGALAATWWVPVFADGGSPLILAAAALALGALLAFLLQIARNDPAETSAVSAPARESDALAPDASALREPTWSGVDLGLAAFLGGALLVGGQLAMLRVIAQWRGDSVVTTSQVLTGIHLGMALGAAWMAFPSARVAARALVGLLLTCAALALMLPALLPEWSPRWFAEQAGRWDGWLFPLALTVPLGLGAGSLVTAASRARAREATRLGSWVGDLAAWSTVGGVAGSLAYGAWLAPSPDWGTGAALRLMALVALGGGALLVLRALAASAQRASALFVAVLLIGTSVLAWRTPALEMPWRVEQVETALLEQLEGPHGVVSLVATEDGQLRLKLDNRFGLGGSEGAALEQRMGRLSACFKPEAERALVLGLGRGQTLAGLASTSAARVDCVEHNGQILQLGLDLPYVKGTGPVGEPPAIHHADARAWIAEHPAEYDLIVGDLFHPWMTGAGDLLSREQFLAMRRGLRPEGVVVQWVPLHQIPWPAFGAVTRAFLEVFPTGRLFVATPLANRPLVALVGGMLRGLPKSELVDALLAASPSPVGPHAMADVYDLYVNDAWGLSTRFLDMQPATQAWPVSEIDSLGRSDDEAWIGATNMRQLSELTEPLETSALTRPPITPREDKQLGMELRARSAALRGLLLARAAMLDSALSETDETRRAEAEMLASSALLEAWRVAPGHVDGRRALVEWARSLAAQGRALQGAQLLSAALETLDDPALAGVLGNLFLQMEMVEEAADLLGQVYAVQSADRLVLFDYATALLLAGRDVDAAKMLRRVISQGKGIALPPLQAVALGLLEGDPAAGPAADALLDELPPGSLWHRTLTRLRAVGS